MTETGRKTRAAWEAIAVIRVLAACISGNARQVLAQPEPGEERVVAEVGVIGVQSRDLEGRSRRCRYT